MAVAYHQAGYTGIIVTDHFLNGNTSVPPNQPWADRVNQFCLGYENALHMGEKIGLQVFFGWEYGYYAMDFLTYGLDKAFLLAHPDMLSWPIDEYFDRVHQNGGFITHAHPFRERPYIEQIRLYPDKIDAIETYNASHEDLFNQKALEYAEKHSLPQTSGSDAHNGITLLGAGIECDSKLNSITDFIMTIKSKQGYALLTPTP